MKQRINASWIFKFVTLVGKGFRCTLRSDDAVKGAKERLPWEEEEEREGRRKEERRKKVFN